MRTYRGGHEHSGYRFLTPTFSGTKRTHVSGPSKRVPTRRSFLSGKSWPSSGPTTEKGSVASKANRHAVHAVASAGTGIPHQPPRVINNRGDMGEDATEADPGLKPDHGPRSN